MPEERFEEKTEPATPRRRREARERGHVARSADLSSAGILLVAVAVLAFCGQGLAGGMSSIVSDVLGRLEAFGTDGRGLLEEFGAVTASAAMAMVPFLVVVLLAAVAVHLLQVGFLFVPGQLAPRIDRLDPVAGLGRIFSARSFVRLGMGGLKVLAVGIAVGLTIWGEREQLAGLSSFPPAELAAYGVGAALALSLRAIVALLILAILEYGFQRIRYERELRMSRTEVREEMKRYEGDPKVRERRRALQRQLALQRMLGRVPEATVVVTNPSRLAVALRYEAGETEVPVVVAKGAERLAGRIRAAALEHGIPIVERPEAARALYRGVEVGRAIPPGLYGAVAEVLTFVMRLKGSFAEAAA